MGNGKKGPESFSDKVVRFEKREQQEIDKRITEAKINNLRLRIKELKKVTPESDEINDLEQEIARLERPKVESAPQPEEEQSPLTAEPHAEGTFASLPENEPEFSTEGTPKENRKKFLEVMARARERLGVDERHEQLKIYLAERSKKLNETAKEYGPKIAALVSSGIEKYNKLHWAKKLFVTGTLVAGVSLTSAIAPLISGALTAALYGQRIVGGIGYAENKREKLDKKIAEHPEHWLANKSELMKNTYSVALAAVYMGGTMLAVHEGVETLNTLGVNEWLARVFNGHEDTPIQPYIAPAPEVVNEVVSPISTPEMPTVEASPGHGYEYMVKRLWEDLHEKGITLPEKIAPDSDLAKLLNADNDSIDRVVHQIASDSQHGFFNADGTNILIDPSAHLTIGIDGQLHFADATHLDMVHAAENMSTTPAYHPEAPAMPPASVEAATVSPEVAPVPIEQPFVVETPAPDASVLHDSSGNVVHDSAGNPVHTGTYEPSAEGSVEHTGVIPENITNHFGLSVPTNEVHFYTDPGAKHLFIYGGSPLERANAIQEYLAEKPDAVVFSADDSGKYRIPWHLVEGKATPEMPVQTRGFLGFFKSLMKAPEPNEFEKSIK